MNFIKNYQFNLVRKSQKIVLGLFLIVLMELEVLSTGITPSNFFKFFKSLFTNFIEKFGLAASCIKTFLGLNLERYLKDNLEESALDFPPKIK